MDGPPDRPPPRRRRNDEPTFARRLHYDRPIETSLAVVSAVRDASLDLMAAMTPADWARSGTHSEIGPYTVDLWLEIYADHVHDHADKIRRARRDEASGSGPQFTPLGGTLLGDGPIGDAPTALAVADTARTETLPETRLD